MRFRKRADKPGRIAGDVSAFQRNEQGCFGKCGVKNKEKFPQMQEIFWSHFYEKRLP